MPTYAVIGDLADQDAKRLLLETCRSKSTTQNLERLLRCLLNFWDPAKCILNVDNDIASGIFEQLRYGPDNVDSNDLSSLSLLDIKVFLHLCVHCAYVRSERNKDKAGANARKVASLTVTDQLTTESHRSWWRAAWALCHGTGKQDDRVKLQEGLEVVRLKSRDVPELPLLLSAAAMLEKEVPDASRYGVQDRKAVAASDYAKLYWTAIDQILERDRVMQPKPDSFFYAGLPPLPRTRRDHYRSLAKYYHALNALMHGKDDECITMLEQLQTPQAFFTLAQIYKNSADNITGRQGDPDTESRKRAMLLKAKDALRSALNVIQNQSSGEMLSEMDVSKLMEELDASFHPLSTSTGAASSNGDASRQQQGDLSELSDLRLTPLASTASFFTPVSRYVPPHRSAGNSGQASLLLELGQSVDYALRSLTQSQETLVRGIMEQNRALTNTCDGMMNQLKELTLTNKALVDELKEMRRENQEYRVLASGVESVRSRSHLVDDSYYPYQQLLATAPVFPPLPQQQHQPFSVQQPAPFIQQPCFVPELVPQIPEPKPPLSELEQFKSKPAAPSAILATAAATSSSVFMPSFPLTKTPTVTTGANVVASQLKPLVEKEQEPAGSGATSVFGSSAINASGFSFAALPSKNAPPAPAVQPFQGFTGFGGSEPHVFGNMSTSTPTRARQTSENDDAAGAEVPFEPTVDFKPVIPLPALVEAKTGEEGEEVLFRERAKLYRFDPSTKELKERGLGELKILKHAETGAVRIVMRRDQVFKLCANNRITPGMKLAPLQKSDRAFIWNCQDYSDGELKNETLAARFKEPQHAQKFKEVFDASAGEPSSSVNLKPNSGDPGKMAKVGHEKKPPPVQPPQQAPKSKPQTTSHDQKPRTAGIGAAAPSAPATTGAATAFGSSVVASSVPTTVGRTGGVEEKIFGSSAAAAAQTTSSKPPLSALEQFKPKPGSWECKDCYTRNDASAVKCVCCGAASPSAPAVSAASSKPPFAASFPFSTTTTTASNFKPMMMNGKENVGSGAAPIFGLPPGGSATGGGGVSFAALAANNTTAPNVQPFQGFKGFTGAGTQIFGTMTTSTPQRNRQESETDDVADAEVPFEPTAEFKPVIPLPALVEAKSGEEDEEVLFRERAKLYRFDPSTKEYKERGVGDLKILKHNETGAVRVVMRRDQVFKLCANHRIQPGMKLSLMQKSDRAFIWNCQDYSDGELNHETLAARFKEVQQAQKFKETFEAAASSAAAASGEERTGRAAAPEFGASVAVSSAPTTVGRTGGVEEKRFGSSTAAAAATPPSFGGGASIFGVSSSSSSTSGLSFAALAAKHATAPAFQPNQGFKGFAGAGMQIFGNVKTSSPETKRQESESDDTAGAEAPFEPNVDFKPVIPLPALVEAKSGEEDEQVLFRERAKLYRFDPSTKEFKERGLGELKILKHAETGAVRIVMRRDQVFKLCANHRIHPGMKLAPLQKSDRAFIWNCQDYSEGELKNETLVARFKEPKQAQTFKEVFEEVAAASADDVAPSSTTGVPKVESDKAGDKVKTVDDADGVKIVYEKKGIDADESRAEKYQLPKLFFVDSPPCSGCIGCASEEEQDKILHQLDVAEKNERT